MENIDYRGRPIHKKKDADGASLNTPNFVEKQFNKLVDYSIVLTTYELWGCWDCVGEENDDSRDEVTAVTDESSDCSDDREEETCAASDTSTAYSSFFLGDDLSNFTLDEESLYSQYSRHSNLTNADDVESLYSRSARSATAEDAGETDEKEQDMYDRMLVEALKRHAVSLGISELELLRRLEAEQEAMRKSEKLETVNEMEEDEESSEPDASEQTAEAKHQTEDRENAEPEEEDVGNSGESLEQRDKFVMKTYLGLRRKRVSPTRQKRASSKKKKRFQRLKVVS